MNNFDPVLLSATNGNGATAIEEPGPSSGTGPKATVSRTEPEGDGEAPISAPNFFQIPARFWTDERIAQLSSFLDAELNLCEMERSEKMRKFAEYLIAYKAPSEDWPKNFPVYNGSNLTIPVIKEKVNVLVAQIAQSSLVTKPRWVLEGLAAEWKPFTDDIEQFLDLASDRDLKFRKAALSAITECVKLGTAVLETAHEIDQRNIYKYSADGKKVFKSDRLAHDGPIVKHIPIQKFWIRLHEKEIEDARWCAKELEYTSAELLEKERQGKFYGVKHLLKTVRGSYMSRGDDVTDAQWEAELTKPLFTDSFKIYETRISWDIDGDNKYEELQVFYSRDARHFICAKFNPYWHGKRGFSKMEYFPGTGFYAEGLCEMLEDIQKGVSRKTNVRNDNESMANLKMFLKRKMVKGLMPGDPLYPGKQIEVNDIWNDIREFQMSEIYPSTVNSEMLLWSRAEALSGAGDAQTGGAMPVTRTTAAAQLALLQEQAKRVDLTVSSVRECFNEIGWFTTQLFFQFGTNGKAVAWLGERGKSVEAIFRMPRRVVEMGLAIKAQTPTSVQNRQVKRENSIALLNLLIQIHEKLLPFAQHLAPEAMGEVAHGMVRAATRYLSDTLATFETPDPEELLAGLLVLEKVLPAPEDLGGMAAYSRATAADQTDDRLARLEGLLRSVESFGAGNDGIPARGQQRGRATPPEGLRGGGAPSTEFGGPSY